MEDLVKKTRTVNDAIIQIVNTDLILRGYITAISSLLDNRTLHQDLRKHVGSFINICWCWRTIFAETVHLVESQQSGLLSIKEAEKFYMYIEYFRFRVFFMKIESVTEEYWFLAVRESCKHLTLILEDKAIRICIRLLSAMFEYVRICRR